MDRHWPGVAFLLLYGGAIGYDRIIERFLAIEDHAGSRVNIWKDTWAIIKYHPFDIGLGNYEHVMPVYNTLGRYGVNYGHAHNDYLQVLAKTEMNPKSFYITVGAISGLTSMAFHSFLDSIFRYRPICFILWC